MEKAGQNLRVSVILAGGGSRRMGGADKGGLLLGGRRIFDLVLERLKPQSEIILISGAHDYGSGLTVLTDETSGPRGPAAGLWAALKWMEENAPGAPGFLAAPVDGPFLPPELRARLASVDGSAVAANSEGVHPTFAYWRRDALKTALDAAPANYGYPLKELAERVSATPILFKDAHAFDNINTPDDLKRAEARLRA